MRRLFFILTIPLAALAACGEQDRAPVASEPLDWMVEHADDYLNDPAFRRAEIEASLWQPQLPYARKRLEAYALGDRGWDLLPVLETRVEPVRVDHDEASFEGRDLLAGPAPTTREEWLSLGEDVFFNMPMRRDNYLEWVVTQPQLWDEVGLQTSADGTLRGVVKFRDARGDVRIGASCALCHGDQGIPGRATRTLDLGKGRALFAAVNGVETPQYLAWGPGRVDVTDDATVDALTIPDLWGARHQAYLNTSAAVRIASPASFAVRFETQYIVGHSMEARPDRTLTWALAMYVQSLEPPADLLETPDPSGEELFERHCASCHQPDRGFSGDLVTPEQVGSDPDAANSPLRGTGFYKVPSLIGVADGGPYLHDSSASSLEALIDQGHPVELGLGEAERDTLIHFVRSL